MLAILVYIILVQGYLTAPYCCGLKHRVSDADLDLEVEVCLDGKEHEGYGCGAYCDWEGCYCQSCYPTDEMNCLDNCIDIPLTYDKNANFNWKKACEVLCSHDPDPIRSIVSRPYGSCPRMNPNKI